MRFDNISKPAFVFAAHIQWYHITSSASEQTLSQTSLRLTRTAPLSLPLLQELLSANPCKHPIVYLKDVQHEHLAAVVEFMYSGAVYVGNEHLDDVLSVSDPNDITGHWGRGDDVRRRRSRLWSWLEMACYVCYV